MTAGRRSMFLIDADNVAVEVIEKALALKQELHGAIHVKRCYCSADFALKNLAFLKAHSIRAMVNVTAGKNCTDIALAIDAVGLCEREPAEVVVIVASDSDFAPLVMHRGRVARAPAAPPRRASRSAAVVPASAPARTLAVPGDVTRWLRAVPGLASGDRVELKVAAEALRKGELLSRNASSTTLFRKHPDWFELIPARQPNSVRFRAT